MAARVDKTAGVKVLASRIVIDPFLPPLMDDYDIHRDGRRLCDSASRKPDAGRESRPSSAQAILVGPTADSAFPPHHAPRWLSVRIRALVRHNSWRFALVGCTLSKFEPLHFPRGGHR